MESCLFILYPVQTKTVIIPVLGLGLALELG